MLGVVRGDQPASHLTDFFTSMPYENAFVTGSDGTLKKEIEQSSWRRFLCSDRNPNLSISDSLVLFEADPGVAEIQSSKPSSFAARLPRLLPTLDTRRHLVGTTVSAQGPRPAVDACGLVMAGGFGKRLGELTKTTPKPMLPIAGKPICEHLVDSLQDSGVNDLFFSLHYLGDVVRNHFGDGSDRGARFRYSEEKQPLGTAGCLSLIADQVERPLVVVNGDVVTNLQFARLLDFHKRSGSDITMSVRRHYQPIQYGVVEHEDGVVSSIKEKPKIAFDINVAIYVLEPEVVRHVPQGVKTDMPDFIRSMIPAGYKVSVFPVQEQWIDVGTPVDFARADREYDPAARPRLAGMPMLHGRPAAA